MEQLSTRASSLGERDMPSRPMSRRVSASKQATPSAAESKRVVLFFSVDYSEKTHMLGSASCLN